MKKLTLTVVRWHGMAWHGMAWHGVLCICSKLQLTALISNAYILNEYKEK
jgi:hypothetical protein